jgi:hypothetical protein
MRFICLLGLATCLVAGAGHARPLPEELEALPEEEAARLCIISLDAAQRDGSALRVPGTLDERSALGTLFVLQVYWMDRLTALAKEEPTLRGDLQRHIRLPESDRARLRQHCEAASLARIDRLPSVQEKDIVERGLRRMRESLGE